jgi:excisionase family DNA binding protein
VARNARSANANCTGGVAGVNEFAGFARSQIPSSTLVGHGSHPALFENLITKKELAQMLSVSEGLINRQMAEEQLPHVKIGRAVRFRLSDVLAWFDHKGN